MFTTPEMAAVFSGVARSELAEAEEIHAATAGSELVGLPEAAHLSNLELSDEFNERGLEFLTGREHGRGQALSVGPEAYRDTPMSMEDQEA